MEEGEEAMSIISIVGNIGAGKSYFCNRIRDLFSSISVFNENIEGYKDLVELYYKDKRKYTSSFQVFMLYRKALNLIDAKAEGGLCVVERTLEDNCQIFALKQHQENCSSKIAWCQYMRFYLHLIRTIPQPDIYLYLKAEASLLYQRIHSKRKRAGEELITMDYLEDINSRYDTWIEELRERGEKIYTIQVDHDFSDREIKDIFKKVVMAQEELNNEAVLLV